MEQDQQNAYNLSAYVEVTNTIPALRIEGTIQTNGEKVIIELEQENPQGLVPQDLYLKLSHDVYDPKGLHKVSIIPFNKSLNTPDQYISVIIETKAGPIHLTVEVKESIV